MQSWRNCVHSQKLKLPWRRTWLHDRICMSLYGWGAWWLSQQVWGMLQGTVCSTWANGQLIENNCQQLTPGCEKIKTKSVPWLWVCMSLYAGVCMNRNAWSYMHELIGMVSWGDQSCGLLLLGWWMPVSLAAMLKRPAAADSGLRKRPSSQMEEPSLSTAAVEKIPSMPFEDMIFKQ